MANFVTNVIICREDLVSKIVDGDGNVDFGILVPHPENKEECIEKYGEEYLDGIDANGHSIKHLQHSNGDDWFDWYKWNCDFWGCKWNASDADVNRRDGLVFIQFDTAWSPPMPWIAKLAKLGKPFILHWTEEQGFGEYKGYNGATELEGGFDIPEYTDDGEPIYDDEEDRDLPSNDTLNEFFGDK